MIKVDAMVLGLLKTLEDNGVCAQIRKNILDDESKVPNSEYDTACLVLGEASEEYFKLGFEMCKLLFFKS